MRAGLTLAPIEEEYVQGRSAIHKRSITVLFDDEEEQ